MISTVADRIDPAAIPFDSLAKSWEDMGGDPTEMVACSLNLKKNRTIHFGNPFTSSLLLSKCAGRTKSCTHEKAVRVFGTGIELKAGSFEFRA
eukprot:gene26224-biopygen15040